MPISFANVTSNIKVPLYWVELDPSMAGLHQTSIPVRALMVGVMIADGHAAHGTCRSRSASQAQADQASRSRLRSSSRMFQAFYANNFANEVWALPLAEPTAGRSCGRDHHDRRAADRGWDAVALHRRLAGQRHQHHGHRHRWRYLLAHRRSDQQRLCERRPRRCRSPPLLRPARSP